MECQNDVWQVWVPNMASVRGENEEKVLAVGSTKVCGTQCHALAALLPKAALHPHMLGATACLTQLDSSLSFTRCLEPGKTL